MSQQGGAGCLGQDSLSKIEKWAASGATFKEMARRLGIGDCAFSKLRRKHPEINQAIERGRRRGPSRKPRIPDEWTAAETRYVSRLAGLVPIGRIAADLGRDVADVADECARIGVDPRYAGVALQWCDLCSSWRPTMTRSGHCMVCERRAQLARIEGRISDLLSQLPPETRAIYADTEAERGSRTDPPPAHPATLGMGEREEIEAESAYLASYAEWEAAQISRRVKAAQKRKERIQRKVREYEAGRAAEARSVEARARLRFFGDTRLDSPSSRVSPGRALPDLA